MIMGRVTWEMKIDMTTLQEKIKWLKKLKQLRAAPEKSTFACPIEEALALTKLTANLTPL